ncbi:MAG: DUF2911 domain-containing protein, partial [Planctomycetota bacterium]
MRTAALLLSLFAPILAADATAQIQKPPLSPRTVVEQEVGLGKVELEYSRPGVKGRKIFGELEPYGVVWRTGANSSTKITFSDPVNFGGQDVPAGRYALYSIPGEKTWTVILSKNADLWGAGGYDPKEDQVRIEVEPQALPALHETLTIDFEGFHSAGANLFVAWENTKIVVPIGVDTDSKVMAQIEERVRKATGEVAPRTYFDAAIYLFEQKRDLEDAAAWIKKAVDAS